MPLINRSIYDAIGESGVGAHLALSCATFADRLAIQEGDRKLSYGELHNEATAVAHGLRQLGLKSGEPLLLWSDNCWQWVVSAMACWMLDAVLVPISFRAKRLEVEPILRDTQASILISGADVDRQNLVNLLVADKAGKIENVRQVITLSGNVETHLMCTAWRELYRHGPVFECKPNPGCDPAAILYTSGSTGTPKGVMLSNQAIIKMALATATAISYNSDDRILVIPPLSHITGINAILMSGLVSGAALILLPGLTLGRFSGVIHKVQPTMLIGAPALFAFLLREADKHDNVFDSVTTVCVGGAPLTRELVLGMVKQIKPDRIVNIYGSTEGGVITIGTSDDGIDHLVGSVGRPLAPMEIKVVGNQGEDLAADATGEVCARGQWVCSGYFNDKQKSQEAFIDSEWLRTGDLGRIDSQGQLQIRGRKTDMYISHGFNVYSSEVDSLFLSSNIADQFCAIGRPSRMGGEEGVLFFVPRPDSDPQDVIKSLRLWGKKNISNYKVPVKYFPLNKMPVNHNGKIDKQALFRMLD